MPAAIRATSFIGTLGVNTHIGWSGAYANIAEIGQNVKYLGVPTVRDSIADASVIPQWKQVAQAAGIKFDDYLPEGAPAWCQTALGLVPQLVSNGLLSFVEGGNEEDDSYAISNGNTLSWTAQFQQQVWATGQQYHLPVINMSFGAGWTWLNNWHGDYDKVGDLSAFTNYSNAHTYPNVGQTPDSSIQQLNSDALLAAGSRPVITTEFGWETSQYGLTQIAQFVVDATFDGIKNGDAGMWYYGLYDDGSGNWGLFNSDGSARPAATALHNLTTLLADTGATAKTFNAGSLNYSLAGTQSGDNSFLLEKSDGSYWIGLWNESAGPHTVTVNLPSSATSITVYDPITGTSAIKSVSNASSVSVSLGADPLLVKVGGTTTGGGNTPPAVNAPGSEALNTSSSLSVSGVSIADSNANAGTITVTVSDTAGNLKMTNGGTAVAGSGTHAITVSGSLSQINAELATLQYTSGSTAGTDSIAISVKDQTGESGSGNIGVTIKSPTSTTPSIAAPASETLSTKATVAVSPVSVTDSFAATNGGSMALNVWDKSGTLTIGGKTFGPGGGPVAFGMFSGSLSQINSYLSSLKYTAGATAGSDTVTVDVWDQAGTHFQKNIPVTVSGGTTSGGGGTTVTIAATDATPVITQSNVKAVATSGNHSIYIDGTGDVICAVGGTETVMAFLGHNTIRTGGYNDTIRIAGTGSVVNAGAGSNEIDDSGSGNRIILPAAGQGSDKIFGYIMANADTLDLRAMLKATAWTGTSNSIGNFLHVNAPNGADAVISVTPTGVAGGASYNVATLEGTGPISLPTLLAHSITS